MNKIKIKRVIFNQEYLYYIKENRIPTLKVTEYVACIEEEEGHHTIYIVGKDIVNHMKEPLTFDISIGPLMLPEWENRIGNITTNYFKLPTNVFFNKIIIDEEDIRIDCYNDKGFGTDRLQAITCNWIEDSFLIIPKGTSAPTNTLRDYQGKIYIKGSIFVGSNHDNALGEGIHNYSKSGDTDAIIGGYSAGADGISGLEDSTLVFFNTSNSEHKEDQQFRPPFYYN